MIASHYNFGKAQDMITLRKSAKLLLQQIINIVESPTYAKTKPIPLLIYSGMSGVAGATAIGLAAQTRGLKRVKIALAYVRKPDEESHGQAVEYSFPDEITHGGTWALPIFVDDFISSGRTGNYVFKRCCEYLPQYVRLISGDGFCKAVLYTSCRTDFPLDEDSVNEFNKRIDNQ